MIRLITSYYIKYINRVTLASFQPRPLKLGNLIVLQETHLRLSKVLFRWQLTLSTPHPLDFNMSVIFSSKPDKWGHKLKLTYLCLRDHAHEDENLSPKVARNAFNIGEVWNPVCCHRNQTVKLVLWSTFSRMLLQRIKISDTNWLRYRFSSYLIIIWLSGWLG